MDYDTTEIAVVYDRARDHGPENLQLWMNVLSSCAGTQPITGILDLGCGTGRFTEALAAHFDADVVGVDPSTKMLDQARKKLRDPRVQYQSGSGEAIPLADGSVDLVFMSMCFHHFTDPKAAARECRRVLRDGGLAVLRTGVRERIPLYPYVEFFPASLPIMEDILPTVAFVREVFESAGFSTVRADVITQQIAPDLAAYTEKLAAGADSVLAQLTEEDFQAGLATMHAHAAHTGDTPVCEPIDVLVFR